MKFFRLLIFLFFCSLPPATAHAHAHANEPTSLELPPLILSAGEQRMIQVTPLKKYSLGGQSVRIIALPKELHSKGQDRLLIKGVQVGFSDLWVWKTDGSVEHRPIRVDKNQTDKDNAKLEQSLQKLNETEVFFSGPASVTLRGEIRSLAEAAKVAALKRGFPKEIQDETSLSSALLEQGFKRIESWLKASGKKEKMHLTRDGGTIWVRGSIQTSSERKEIEREIHALFPPAILELDALPDSAPTVYFRVFLLEVKRNHFHQLGLQWPGEQLDAFRVTSLGVKESIGLDIALQALEAKGSARVLSRPELAVRAPGDAELFAGGELPIRTKTSFTNHVTWKPYGLLLKLKITHIAGENVRLEIQTEVSHLDYAAANDNIPGVKANRMKTQVDAKMGSPLLLSGLLQQDMREQARGLPWIRRIPVLGLLFGSEDYLSARSELVAILLPMQAPPPASIPSKGEENGDDLDTSKNLPEGKSVREPKQANPVAGGVALPEHTPPPQTKHHTSQTKAPPKITPPKPHPQFISPWGDG